MNKLDRLLELAEKKGEKGLWTEEYDILKDEINNDLETMTEKRDLWKRSYEESERCLLAKQKECLAFESRYKMLEERYINKDKKFTDYCELYFVDEPYG